MKKKDFYELLIIFLEITFASKLKEALLEDRLYREHSIQCFLYSEIIKILPKDKFIYPEIRYGNRRSDLAILDIPFKENNNKVFNIKNFKDCFCDTIIEIKFISNKKALLELLNKDIDALNNNILEGKIRNRILLFIHEKNDNNKEIIIDDFKKNNIENITIFGYTWDGKNISLSLKK